MRVLRRCPLLVGAAAVLDDPDVPVAVVLDAFVPAAAKGAGDVGDGRRVARGGRVRRVTRALGREQQPLRPRVPGRAVDRRDRRSGRVRRGKHRHPVSRVGVEVDPRDVAGRAGLVALEQEVGAVVVARVGTRKAAREDQVRVLVRLRLVRLVHDGWRRQHLRIAGRREHVVVVAVVRDGDARVFDLRRALRNSGLPELRRELARRREARRLRVRRGHVGEARPADRRGPAACNRQDRRRARGREHGDDRSSPLTSHLVVSSLPVRCEAKL